MSNEEKTEEKTAATVIAERKAQLLKFAGFAYEEHMVSRNGHNVMLVKGWIRRGAQGRVFLTYPPDLWGSLDAQARYIWPLLREKRIHHDIHINVTDDQYISNITDGAIMFKGTSANPAYAFAESLLNYIDYQEKWTPKEKADGEQK